MQTCILYSNFVFCIVKLYHNTLGYHNPAKYSVKDYNLVNYIKYFNNRNLNQKKRSHLLTYNIYNTTSNVWIGQLYKMLPYQKSKPEKKRY